MVLRFPKMFLRLAESVGVAARLAACRNAGPDHEGICPMASRWRAPVAIIRGPGSPPSCRRLTGLCGRCRSLDDPPAFYPKEVSTEGGR